MVTELFCQHSSIDWHGLRNMLTLVLLLEPRFLLECKRRTISRGEQSFAFTPTKAPAKA